MQPMNFEHGDSENEWEFFKMCERKLSLVGENKESGTMRLTWKVSEMDLV